MSRKIGHLFCEQSPLHTVYAHMHTSIIYRIYMYKKLKKSFRMP